MVQYYRELTRLEMEAVDKEETVVMIPIGALEQHGNSGQGNSRLSHAYFSSHSGGTQHRTHKFLRLHYLKTGYVLSYALRYLQRPAPPWV